MPQLRRSITAAGAGLAAVAVTALTTVPSAAAAVPAYGLTRDPVQAAAGWLVGQFAGPTHLPAPDGDHFDSRYGTSYFPNYGENADVVFGLAAAKSGGTKIATALDYLQTNLGAYADSDGSQGFGPADGSYAKSALAAIVAGQDPTHFGGTDLMAALKNDECAAGSTTCTPGSAANIYASASESFVILAEARFGGSSAPTPQAEHFFLSLQCVAGTDAGGFTTNAAACGSGAADLDATSYGLMALQALGGHPGEVATAVTWLRAHQSADGSWGDNANSTGLAAAALQGVGQSVSTARSWLLSQQAGPGTIGAGAIKYTGAVVASTTSATSPSVIATAQALTGLVNGGSLATVSAAGASSGVGVFAPRVSLSASTVHAGHSGIATATGFAPGETVRVGLGSATTRTGTATADALGSVRARFLVPSSAAAGRSTVVLTGHSSQLSAAHPITVTVTATPAASSAAAASGARTSTVLPVPTSTETVAATGQDGRRLAGVSVAGLLAVLAGAGLLVLGRRRQH